MSYYNKVYYYHPLDLTFKSAQTLQVIKDYCHLSKLGISVVVYGSYTNINDLLSIQQYIVNSNLKIISSKRSFFGKTTVKLAFFLDMLFSTGRKIIVTRHYRKLSKVLQLKKFMSDIKVLHEMHEESFPYLFKPHIRKNKIKSLLLNEFLDCIIFTNYSQEIFFEREFGQNPKKSKVLPNGVEFEKFRHATMSENFVLTYLGQFNQWKNVELIFEALSLLDDRYTLRVAGGKNDKTSQEYIFNLIKKYNINPDRVDYLGFVNNSNIVDQVLMNSHVLLLPLGDNIQSIHLTSPMKLFEYMSTKIPILAVDFPSVRLITSDKIFLSPNSGKFFSDQIRVICSTKKTDFNFRLMNDLVQKYSYKNRSNIFLKEVINEL